MNFLSIIFSLYNLAFGVADGVAKNFPMEIRGEWADGRSAPSTSLPTVEIFYLMGSSKEETAWCISEL